MVVQILVLCLEDNTNAVKSHAASAVGKIGDCQAVEPLARFLNREMRQGMGNVHTCYNAIDALRKLGYAYINLF